MQAEIDKAVAASAPAPAPAPGVDAPKKRGGARPGAGRPRADPVQLDAAAKEEADRFRSATATGFKHTFRLIDAIFFKGEGMEEKTCKDLGEQYAEVLPHFMGGEDAPVDPKWVVLALAAANTGGAIYDGYRKVYKKAAPGGAA